MTAAPLGADPEVAAYYDAMQRFYSRLWHPTGVHYGLHGPGARGHAAAVRAMDDLVADALSLPRGSRVLDAGCGVGGTSFHLAATRGHRVTGITISADQLRRAASRARRTAAGRRPAFRLASYTRTGEPDEAFDGIFGIESVCYADPPGAFFEEARRILRPGGRLVVADGFAHPRPDPQQARDLRAFCDGFAIRRLATVDELVEAAETAGLDVLDVNDVSRRVLPSATRIERLSRLGVLLDGAIGLVTATPAVWRLHCGAGLVQRRLLESGGMRYAVITAAARPA